MNYEQMNNNKVILMGTVISKPELSHEIYGEKFYELMLSVARISESVDEIPITVSEKLMENNTFSIGNIVAISGQFRSYNKLVGEKSKLLLTVFVRELLETDSVENPNSIEICGFICKNPIYRTTPFKREICDLLVAVNRAYNKSDYLPNIAWGRNARFCSQLVVGTKVDISGRIQSRAYQKKIDDINVENKVAYEISISKINIVKDVENEEKEESIVLLDNQSPKYNTLGV